MSKEKPIEGFSETTSLVSEIADLKERFDIIVNHAESVEIWVQADMTVAFIPQGIEKITGYSAEEFIRDPGLFRKMIHPDDIAEYDHYYSGNGEITAPGGIDRRIIRKDGETRWIHTKMTKLYDDHGNYNGFRSSTTDITGRILAEMKLEQAFSQIRELEEKYRIVADNTYDMERWILPDLSLAYISPSCEKVTGYTREEFMNNPDLFREIIHPCDKERFSETRNKIFRGEEFTNSICLRIIHRNGQVRCIDMVGMKVYDKKGCFCGLRTSSRDITLQKELEAELETKNKMFSSIAEDQVDMIIRTDGNGVVTYINNSFAGFFGLNKETVINRKYFEWADPEDIEKAKKSVMLLTGENPTMKVVFDYTRSSGKVVFIEWIFHGTFDQEGKLTNRLGIGRDVTENVRLSQQLVHSEAQYKAIVNNQTELIVRHSPDSTILFVNETFAGFHGIKDHDLIGMKWFDLVPDEVALQVKMLMESITPDNHSSRYEMVNKRFDGEERYISWISTGLFDRYGKMTELQVVGRDITESVETGQKLQKALAEVEKLKFRLEQENLYLREKFQHSTPPDGIITDSPLMHGVLNKVRQVAQTESPVLIYGETGTGKELIAHAIHNASRRHRKLMITVNCAALPPSLIESELFGREKGAYTGALSSQIGRFELANNSTIFLDEIGELPFEIQVKLLRVIQFGEYQMLGSPETRKVDVRIIAATNKDLIKALAEGSFRNDLFYRLNVFPINLPPLRERKEDIPLLAWAFVDKIAGNMGKKIDKISTAGMNILLRHNWPGNIRELRNIIEYSIILSSGPVLEIHLQETETDIEKTENLDIEQRRHIEKVLKQTGWRIRGSGGAAEKLGMKESTLRFRMKKLGIERKK